MTLIVYYTVERSFFKIKFVELFSDIPFRKKKFKSKFDFSNYKKIH